MLDEWRVRRVDRNDQPAALLLDNRQTFRRVIVQAIIQCDLHVAGSAPSKGSCCLSDGRSIGPGERDRRAAGP